MTKKQRPAGRSDHLTPWLWLDDRLTRWGLAALSLSIVHYSSQVATKHRGGASPRNRQTPLNMTKNPKPFLSSPLTTPAQSGVKSSTASSPAQGRRRPRRRQRSDGLSFPWTFIWNELIGQEADEAIDDSAAVYDNDDDDLFFFSFFYFDSISDLDVIDNSLEAEIEILLLHPVSSGLPGGPCLVLSILWTARVTLNKSSKSVYI